MKKKVTKPILRWAGGKSWLIKHLDDIIGDLNYNNYFEPFVGGASLFLAINPKNKSYLSDLNVDLVNVYQMIKEHPKEIINELEMYENTEEFYYMMRNKDVDNQILKAAKFIYLNKTSFNGIYRVNNKGEYNVPYGHRPHYNIDEQNFFDVSKNLQNATISCNDFFEIENSISKGDLIILDPPYTVSHNENGFIKYNQKLFSIEDQYRLSEFIDYIRSVGAYYILTNAAHEKISEIFDKEGDIRYDLSRASLIGGKNANRGKIKEFVFTNINKENLNG